MTTESSWHPAFMPNSAADIITKEEIQPSNLLSKTETILRVVKSPSPSKSEPESIIADDKAIDSIGNELQEENKNDGLHD